MLCRVSATFVPLCHRAARPLRSIELFKFNAQQFLSTAAVTHSSSDGNGSPSFITDRIRDFQEERWQRNFKEVHDKLSSGGSIVEPYLKRWIARQRNEYNKRMKGSETTLHDSRLQKLLPLEKKYQIFQLERNVWATRYKELLKFIEENNGLFPYEVDVEEMSSEGAQLLEWCCRQRNLYHVQEKGEKVHGFSAGRLKLLDDIGFSWSMNDVRWTQKYDELVKYYRKHGNSMVPNYYAPNPSLARWVKAQREKQTNNVERKKLLEAVDFVWDPYEYRWMLKYYELKEYTAKYGKGTLPGFRKRKYSTLHRWFSYQKVCYRKHLKGKVSSMTERRKELLQELGFHSEFGETKE